MKKLPKKRWPHIKRSRPVSQIKASREYLRDDSVQGDGVDTHTRSPGHQVESTRKAGQREEDSNNSGRNTRLPPFETVLAPSRAEMLVELLLPSKNLHHSWTVLRPDTHCFHSPLVLQSEDERLEALEDEEEKENGGDPEEKGEAESPRCEEKDS